MHLAAHMNMVNDTRMQEEAARQKAKQMSILAKQRAKELAMYGQSSIAPIRNNPKRGDVRARSFAAPRNSKILQKRGGGSVKLSIEEVSKMMKDDSIAELDEAIEKVRSCLKIMKEKRDLNLELAKERFLSNNSEARTTETSNRIVTIVAMDRVHTLHAKIVQMENVLRGFLTELEINIKQDVVDPDDIKKDVVDILKILNNPPKNIPKFSHDELVGQLSKLMGVK